MMEFKCDRCGTSFARKDNLTRHRNRRNQCRSANIVATDAARNQSLIGQKRTKSPEISTYSDYLPKSRVDNVKPPKNPKIQNLLDALINDSSEGQLIPRLATPQITPLTYQAPPKKILPVFEVKEKPVSTAPPKKVLPPTIKVIEKPQEVDDGLISFTPMKLEAVHGDVPRLRAVDFVTKRSRTNGDISRNAAIVRSGDDDDDDDDDQSDDETIDISGLPPPDKVKFLPATVDGLTERFDKLFREFWQEHKHSHRNELVFLLDELKRQGGITNDMYTRINTLLAKSLGSGIDSTESAMETEKEEQLSEEDQLKKTITSTANYLIEHDKKELLEIVNEFNKDEDIIDTVLELEELIAVYLEDEFLEGESVMEKIQELVDSLSQSKHIPKSLLLKIKMLVTDIAKNRTRVREIVNRFNQAGDDRKTRLWVIKQLVSEELLSEQQYFKLAEVIDELDIKQLTDVIRKTKIGQGMNFLPRKTDELLDTLREWMLEFVENGGTALQSKISAVLNELLQRKKISEERYNELKVEHNIAL